MYSYRDADPLNPFYGAGARRENFPTIWRHFWDQLLPRSHAVPPPPLPLPVQE